MFHTVYKTTNILNGKIYVGYHFTTDPNDNYIGSGKLLKRAIRKYGKDHFRKEVLASFDTAETALAKEAEIVNEDFVSDPTTYNTTVGGGVPPNSRQWWTEAHSNAARSRAVGNTYKLGVKESDDTKARKREAFAKSNTHASHLRHENLSPEMIKKRSDNMIRRRAAGCNPMANPSNVEKVRQSKIGLKKLVKDGECRMAHPDTDKWNNLISLGFQVGT